MKTLFDNTEIKGLSMKNRLVRSATWERMAKEDGHMTAELMNIYKDLAQGGVGMIITGYAFVTKEEQPNPRMMGIYDDTFINDYKLLTDMVHENDSKIVLQIAYGGSATRYQVEGREIWGPSAVEHPRTEVTPKAMTSLDIDTLINAFAQAGLRAKKAGFDGIQLHGAHGYLLSQFLSSYYNRRTDKYGGSITNKARIIFEILEETRKVVGNDFNIMIKINASDFVEEGFTFEECQFVCRELDNLGIDAIEISGGKSSKDAEECMYAPYAATIAEQVECPVIVVGLNRTPQKLEALLNDTEIDYFSMSRPFIREPKLANRWASGDKSKARCISCGKCFDPAGMRCIFV